MITGTIRIFMADHGWGGYRVNRDREDKGDSPRHRLSSETGRFSIKPQTPLGWWGLFMTLISIAAWFTLPSITMTYRETYPITDTWVLPAIGMVLVDAAAVLNVLAVWRRRERSIVHHRPVPDGAGGDIRHADGCRRRVGRRLAEKECLT